MKIEIENTIGTDTSENIIRLNAIIKNALKAKSISEFSALIGSDIDIDGIGFFIYVAGLHVAIHEMLPNSNKANEKRLLLITN